jgi:hypothetical protein
VPDDLAHLRDEMNRQLELDKNDGTVVDLIEDERGTTLVIRRVKRVDLPVARVVASWWRRLLAWFRHDDDITRYCARCQSRLPVGTNEQRHEDECFWCVELEDALRDRSGVVDETEVRDAQEHLSELRTEIKRSRPTVDAVSSP